MGLENDPSLKKPRVRGIYLLPNLLTTAALFAAFYSIVAAMKGNFEVAAIAIFIAMIADGLDGRVARMTNTESEFGAQYDSLSDMVSFGVAPALIVYSWSLNHLGKLGWLVAFVYTAATALRLARFNTQIVDADKAYSQGLPCTTAAPVIAGMVWLGGNYDVNGLFVAIPAAIITFLMAVFMVSRIRYYTFKKLDLKGKVSFFVVVLLVLLLAAVSVAPAPMLFLIFSCSGPVMTLWQIRKMRRFKKMHPRGNGNSYRQ
jgi:CDP-diacylglycerol--serine O-phosphatidyltransferase